MLVQVEIVRVSHFPVKVYKDYRILTKLRDLRIDLNRFRVCG